jgi:hypothetical protein
MFHREVSIGIYEADLVAEQSVILETKTGLVLDPVALVQTLTYLKASHLPLGLVLHFGPRAQVKRVILSRRYSTTGATSVRLKRRSRHDDTNHDAEEQLRPSSVITTAEYADTRAAENEYAVRKCTERD